MDGLSVIDHLSSSRNGTLKLFQYAPSAASIRTAVTTSTDQPAAAPGVPVAIVGLGARLMGVHAFPQSIDGKSDFGAPENRSLLVGRDACARRSTALAFRRRQTGGLMISRNHPRSLALGLILAVAVGAAYRAPAAETASPAIRVRQPAVAGLFYPKDKTQLSRAIDAYLAAAKDEPLGGELKALVCPHAGYAYSGPVAAYGYRLLVGREYETVVVLAPSHYAALRAASVSGADVFRTPLGDVSISEKARTLAKLRPFCAGTQSLRAAPGVVATGFMPGAGARRRHRRHLGAFR